MEKKVVVYHLPVGTTVQEEEKIIEQDPDAIVLVCYQKSFWEDLIRVKEGLGYIDEIGIFRRYTFSS